MQHHALVILLLFAPGVVIAMKQTCLTLPQVIQTNIDEAKKLGVTLLQKSCHGRRRNHLRTVLPTLLPADNLTQLLEIEKKYRLALSKRSHGSKQVPVYINQLKECIHLRNTYLSTLLTSNVNKACIEQSALALTTFIQEQLNISGYKESEQYNFDNKLLEQITQHAASLTGDSNCTEISSSSYAERQDLLLHEFIVIPSPDQITEHTLINNHIKNLMTPCDTMCHRTGNDIDPDIDGFEIIQ